MVFATIAPDRCESLANFLRSRGIVARVTPHMRLVTHLDVDTAAIVRTIAAFKDYFVPR